MVSTLYRINQEAILGAKFGFFLGVPLLCSFLLPALASYRMLSIVLVLIGYWLNNIYPEKIEIRPDCVAVKLLLSRDWIEMANEDLTVEVKANYLVLHSHQKVTYRISMKRLSVRLYKQLEPFFAKCGWKKV